MSTLTYNGITLPYCNCTNFRQEAVYDDLGNTDWILIKFDIEVQALLNANYKDWMVESGGDVAGTAAWQDTTNPSEMMTIIRKKLLEPRQRLSYKFNGVDLIPQIVNPLPDSAGNATVRPAIDSQNGPKPQYCNIQLFTNTSFIVSFRIIAQYWEKQVSSLSTAPANPNDPNTTGNMVLFNRWTETIDIDDKNFSKRTRTGKFLIRSDNYTGKIADAIRSQMAVVGVPQGFMRESSSYTVAPDGLAIQYRIVDKEAFKLPPQEIGEHGVYKASGKYRESLPGYGSMRQVEVRLRLEGSQKTDQAAMLRRAFQICESKLRMNGIGTRFESWPTGGHFIVDMYENTVEVVLQAMTPVRPNIVAGNANQPVNAPTRVFGVAGMNLQAATATPGSDGFPISPNYLDRGTADRLLRAAAYYDPSLANTVLNRVIGQNEPSGVDIGAGGLQEST